MAASQSLVHNKAKVTTVFLLTFVAGFVDIVGYIAVYHLFTANMTGTTVHLGHDLVTGQHAAAIIALSVLGSFVLGSIGGRALIEAGARVHVRCVASITIAIEAALVLTFIALFNTLSGAAKSPASSCLLLVLLAIAMGIQTASLTRIGPLTVHTTFVTGMLNKLAQLISHFLFRSYDLMQAEEHERQWLREARKQHMREALFFFFIWFTYCIAALAGTLCFLRGNIRVMYLPVVLLGIAIVVDQFHPLSLREEEDQMEL
ncbi:MAG: YoaK family protein [Terriglobales bacterium]